MKRIFALILALMMLLSLASCGAEEKKTREEGEEDLSRLSPDRLYETAVNNTKNLPAVRFNTVIESEGTEQEMNTYRAKEGYDSFSYAVIRKGGGLWYLDGKAYCKDENGSFSASMSARAFQEYLDAYYAPIGLFPSEYVTAAQKDGQNVTYELTKEGMALLAKSVKGFSPDSVSVRAKITQEGIVEEETFLMKGTLSGKEVTVNMNTRLLETRGGSIFDLAGMEKPVESQFAPVSDIRIPLLMSGAVEKLALRQNVSLSLLSSFSAKVGDTNFINYEEHTLVQKSPSEFYHALRNTNRVPAGETNILVQRLLTQDRAAETIYNMTTGEKISETEGASVSTPWPALFASGLPSVSALSDIRLEKGTEGETVVFSMTENASREYAKKNQAFFASAGIDLNGFALTSSDGTFTVSEKTGELVALSVSFEGKTAQGTVTAQLSLTLEEGEVTSLPALEVPAPDAVGDDAV